MRWWQPAPDEPELFDWWRPLLAAARRARDEGVQWVIHADEFELLGRVDRSDAATAVWIYRHETSVGYLAVDPDGRAYRFEPDEEQFVEIGIGQAVWAAGLAVVAAQRAS